MLSIMINMWILSSLNYLKDINNTWKMKLRRCEVTWILRELRPVQYRYAILKIFWCSGAGRIVGCGLPIGSSRLVESFDPETWFLCVHFRTSHDTIILRIISYTFPCAKVWQSVYEIQTSDTCQFVWIKCSLRQVNDVKKEMIFISCNIFFTKNSRRSGRYLRYCWED